MEIRISVTEGNLADLESLDDWLRGEPELAGRVRLAGGAPQAGQLGTVTDVLIAAVSSGGAVTVTDVLIAAVSSGGAVTVLAGALKAWLSLPRRANVRIKVHRPDGTTVEIDTDNVTAGRIDVDSMIRQAFDSAADGGPAAVDAGTAVEAAPLPPVGLGE